MTNPLPQLRADLDAIGAQAQAVLRREHRKQATWPALRAGAMLSAFIGVGLVAYLGIATLCDLPFPVLAWPAFGAAIVAPGALYALTQLLSAAMQSVATDAALAAADSRHGLADRLRTAAEFLAMTSTSTAR